MKAEFVNLINILICCSKFANINLFNQFVKQKEQSILRNRQIFIPSYIYVKCGVVNPLTVQPVIQSSKFRRNFEHDDPKTDNPLGPRIKSVKRYGYAGGGAALHPDTG